MIRFAYALLLVLLAAPAFGQGSPTWEQEVAYDMDVTLLAAAHQLRGEQTLAYTNSSPDTLREVYYHLYFNAFQPGSMMAERNRHLPDPDSRVVPRIFELDEDEIGWHRILSLTQDGVPVEYDITDTVMRVDLADPILPGETTVFRMIFRSQVPLQTRRSGRDNREGIDFSMTQWYPKLAGYDERGWHADPYIGREFYAPFGTFDVAITAPSPYVLGGSGVVQNPQEVGYGYGGTEHAPGSPGDSLTWRFRAENVHDFAWAADPDYLHDVIEGERGVTYHLLYQPDVADRWEALRTATPTIIQFFSDRLGGPYPYPQFSVIQGGDGGMEYPMVTLITGHRSPASLFGVTAHEAAHMWFYGLLGFNEQDYPWLDEGFTSWATTEVTAFVNERPPQHTGSMIGPVVMQERGLYEPPSTPADFFTTNAAYGVTAYSAGAMVLDLLGYVMGPEQQQAFLNELYDRFLFRHPNPYDVEKVAEDVSGMRLDWFFWQLTRSTRKLDYAVQELEVEEAGGSFLTEVDLVRKEEMIMPIDLLLTYEDETTQWVTIPLGIQQGHKPVPEDWIVAEPWLWTFPEYELALELPKRVVQAEIDPTLRLPDVDRLNNVSGWLPPIAFNWLQPTQPSLTAYSVTARPLAQYADRFGFGLGAKVLGEEVFDRSSFEVMLKLWPQVIASGGEDPKGELPFTLDFNTDEPDVSLWDGIDYALRFETALPALGRNARADVQARKHLGILENQIGVRTALGGPFGDVQPEVGVALRHHVTPTARRFSLDDLGGLSIYPDDQHTLSLLGRLNVEDGLRSLSVLIEAGSNLDRSRERYCAYNVVGECQGYSTRDLRTITTRFLADLAFGAERGVGYGQARLRLGLAPDGSAGSRRFRLGGASFIDAWGDDTYRSVAAGFDNAQADAHWNAFAPTGPVAYLAPEDGTLGSQFGTALLGTSQLAGSVEAGIQPFEGTAVLGPLTLSAFSGAGLVWGSALTYDEGTQNADGTVGFDFDNLVADAGFGVSYDLASVRALRRWTGQSSVLQGLQLEARFPVWASDPELNGEEEAFAFRYLFGVTVR